MYQGAGFFLCSSQFQFIANVLEKLLMTLKVVKSDTKIIISLLLQRLSQNSWYTLQCALGPCKLLRQLKPFGFYEFTDLWNSTKYKTGQFWGGSETWFPKPKPNFQTYTSILRVFGPRMFGNRVSGLECFRNRVLEPSQNRTISYHSANSKKSQFCGVHDKSYIRMQCNVVNACIN